MAQETHPSGQDPSLTVPSGAGVSLAADLLQRGALLGRYIVLSRIGAGGMGVVYKAYDPELDRRVAIKLLRSRRGDSESVSRLQREAQAMARLSHPNVIAVYDVGTFEDQVFVAMEYVEGPSLARWLQETRPPWREILAVFRGAGRGLAAAHAAGLVHRDFKPDNVLLGIDGRPRVLDFGLARAAEAGADESASPPEFREMSGTVTPSPLASPLTEAGALLGTPAFMSPEQFEGRRAGARSDQFSFGVALWQALFGRHPFGEGPLPLLMTHVVRGEIDLSPADSPVPPWVREAVRRTLHRDPEQRFSSMEELLETLDVDPEAHRRRWWRPLAAIVAVLFLLALALRWQQRRALCEGAADRVASIWNPERKGRMARAFEAASGPPAAGTWTKVEALVDSWVDSWVEQRTEVCAATRLRGEQSEELMDLRMICMEERRGEVVALTELFLEADPDVVLKSVTAAYRLTPLDRCNDASALLAPVRPPADPATRLRVDRLRARLARVKVLRNSGRYSQALELATELRAEVREVGYRPLESEVLHRLGSLQDDEGQIEESESTLFEALVAARASGHEEIAVRSYIDLGWTVGLSQRRFADGERWLRLARAQLDHMAGDDELEASLENALGVMGRYQEHFAEAEKHLLRALELRVKVFGPDHIDVATIWNNLGNLRKDAKDYPRAEEAHRQALDLRRRLLGERHPEVAVSLSNLGNLLRRRGRFEEALEAHRQALDIRRDLLGPDHLEVAASLNNIGLVYFDLEPQKAPQYLRGALEIYEKRLGKDHPSYARTSVNLAAVFTDLGRFDEAASIATGALKSLRQVYGEDHSLVALVRQYLGIALRGRGDLTEALDQFLEELRIQEKVLGPADFELVETLTEIARTEQGLGRIDSALEHLGRALDLAEGDDSNPAALAAQRFELAQALWRSGRDPERAVRLARQAREAYLETGGHRSELNATEAWLAERSESPQRR